jgi:hypothetical protein
VRFLTRSDQPPNDLCIPHQCSSTLGRKLFAA